MNYIVIGNAIQNGNFVIIFITMLLYWFQSSLLISSYWAFVADLSIIFSGILQASFLILRWFDSGHFPLSNLYESLLFLSWVITFILINLNSNTNRFSLKKNKDPALEIKDQLVIDSQKLLNPLVGSILTPLILLINTFATFSLPEELKTSTSLVPALQSNWLLMHVTLMMFSYGALFCGCLLAICYLIITFVLNISISDQNFNSNLNFNNSNKTNSIELEQNKAFSLKLNEGVNSSIKLFPSQLPTTLDNLSYRILSLGFPLLTIGILSGAVWANQTWGSYWSWDPKETWALITWFIFAIYLHTRISKGWTGQKSALIASFGFISIWICYLGVNLLGKGLHSYGFFS